MYKFKAKYSVADGYVGKDRPQYFTLTENDLEEDMDDRSLRELFEQEMQNNFEQNIVPEPSNIDDFVEWAKEILANKS